MAVYRRRGETYRPGSIPPTVSRVERGRAVLCPECYHASVPLVKRAYTKVDPRARFLT